MQNLMIGGAAHPPRPPPVVAPPEDFPQPVIYRSQLTKAAIRITPEIVQTRVILVSRSGNSLYELGETIKKAIYGNVIHAVQIVRNPSNPDEFIRTDRHVAMKVYSKRKLRELQGRIEENALMEINALQYIGDSHPNIMGQIECSADEENIYSVMRYCPGGELFDFIDGNGPLTDEQAKLMFKQLLAGLQRLQELGIGHRDMSLENVLYDGDKLYVIIDFGMCLRLRRNPQNPSEYCFINRQKICGKKNYISPEVFREDLVFNPMLSDIWAIGIILFMALTGAPPMEQATTADERFNMIVAGRLQEMVTAWELGIKPEAVDLIQRLLNSDPLARPSIPEILQHEWLRDA